MSTNPVAESLNGGVDKNDSFFRFSLRYVPISYTEDLEIIHQLFTEYL